MHLQSMPRMPLSIRSWWLDHAKRYLAPPALATLCSCTSWETFTREWLFRQVHFLPNLRHLKKISFIYKMLCLQNIEIRLWNKKCTNIKRKGSVLILSRQGGKYSELSVAFCAHHLRIAVTGPDSNGFSCS